MSQGGFLSCKGAYALRVTFYDSEEKFSIENNKLIYLIILNLFVKKRSMKQRSYGKSI